MEPAGRELWEARVCQEPPKLVTLWHEKQREVFWSRPQESRFLLKTKGGNSDLGFAPLGVGCLQEGKRLRGAAGFMARLQSQSCSFCVVKPPVQQNRLLIRKHSTRAFRRSRNSNLGVVLSRFYCWRAPY